MTNRDHPLDPTLPSGLMSRRRALTALGLLGSAPILSCSDATPTGVNGRSVATLSNLALSAGALSPSFSSSTASYAATVGNAVASVTLVATATDSGATITVNGVTTASGTASGAIALAAGANAIIVLVTSASGANTQSYTVVVTRAATGAASCTLIPQETDGPYPLYAAVTGSAIVRSDVRETKTGVPLALVLTFVNTNASCAPLANAAIYIWHCDKDGAYSGYNVANNGNHTGETFLRGVQVTDANGTVTFTTIFPGWYAGRITHIHFQVYINNNRNVTAKATSQLAFPQAITQAVYASTLYAARGQNSSVASFAADNVFSDGTEFQLATVTGSVLSGYAATLTVGVAV